MYPAGGSQHCGLSRCEGQAHQSRARDFERRLGVGCDFFDAALPGKRGRHVKIAVDIKCQALRTSEATIKSGYAAMRIDLVHGIETRSRRSGDKQVSLWTERQVVCGNTGLERGED